ncbi:hypothetical protein [Leptothoe sp. PORK10 BA2]|uniref:hypothetical protein n=1 Tax=Leptothoe sp. PORK10 BA2 TaxID=3110254 RepID=UPI002B205015|nr:hypothetical protein [Leptothoe sp. PORK10 BA2]MEA5462531.1 hypothetical protein [Leptothoe sp. PORK10 BA2]
MTSEHDFMGQINRNVRHNILLCLLALLTSILVDILTARWIVQLILKLNQSEKDLTQGNWHTPRYGGAQ